MLSSILSLTNRQHHKRFPSAFAACAFAISGFACHAQEIGIKTNLLYDATATINLGAEMKVDPRWSIDLSGNYNPFTFSNGKKWKHWLVQPEIRYWFCEATGGHFVAAHLLGGQYNFGHFDPGFNLPGSKLRRLKDFRYQGWFAGAGIAYGYSWMLGKHWNLEAELGIGYAYTRYDSFECAGCGRKIEEDKPHNYFGPTKAAVNIVYVF